MLPRPSHDRTPRLAAAALSLLLAGCDRGSSQPGAAGSATPAGSGAPVVTGAPAASAGGVTTAASAAGGEPAAPQGAGVTAFTPLGDVPECKAKTGELASYLQRHGLGLAGRSGDGTFAAVWLVELQNNLDAQIAFAGFDGEAKQVARARSIAATREAGVRIIETGGQWSVTWFGADGLTYAQPRWETLPPPEIQRLTAMGKEIGENVAIASTPGGSLVAASPFGPARDQLGVFLFAPADPALPSVKAVGVTHHAKQPRRPAVAADATGYFVAWSEDDGSIRASRFDLAGKEGDAHVLTPPAAGANAVGAAPEQDRLALIATEGAGALALWSEGETLVARALDAAARPSGAAWVVGKGRWRAVAPHGKGALVAWIGNDGKVDGQLLLARLSADGAPAEKGLRISDGAIAVKDPPAVAVAGARVGVAWTEPLSTGVSTKRALLRMLDAACIP